MANITRNFTGGKMNKVVDERLVPNGEYIDAMNVRMGSTENSEMGVIENTKGNVSLTTLAYPIDGTLLSTEATTIGAFEDGANETLYWFVHDPAFTVGATGKLDMIVSYNVLTNILTYHVVSVDSGDGVNTTLNFNPKYLITGVNKVDNLLFFTDDYNGPRKINVKRSYALPSGNIDDSLLWKSILVIKQPPLSSPAVEPFLQGGQENFMEDRFICFAYRYRYADNEYSATSQFSAPCFVPGQFSFDLSTFLNEGMLNTMNGAKITYNSGDELVVGIDLLFKETDNSVIKVIEKLDKAKLGLADNTNYEYEFSNSKIFTVLPDYEILRLYDNVPRYAKAQTMMGNRIMYGNYVEGYDLLDKYGNPVKFEYFTQLVSEEINKTSLTETFSASPYSIDTPPITINDSVVTIDMSSVSLTQGSLLNIELSFNHEDWSGTLPIPSQQTGVINVNFSFQLNVTYASVYEMVTSPEFVNAIGSSLNINPVYSSTGAPTSCDGVTFTDQVNCEIPTVLGTLYKYTSGVSADGQPIEIIASPLSTSFGLKMISMKYVDNLVSPTGYLYEYYSITFADASIQNISATSSLHSNRSYEVGIVYMDEFNRSSTTLVSKDNTEFIPCSNSTSKNSIRVTIPPEQVAPYWATKYKFVIKADEENYETIYSNLFFISPTTGDAWFLLEGDNSRKVEVGDVLTVKADSNGASTSCKKATVLDKQAQAENFLTIPSVTNPSVNITVPSGIYIRLNPFDFNAVFDENGIYAPGQKTKKSNIGGSGAFPILEYPIDNSIDIPAGSRINLSFEFKRLGTGDGNNDCEKRTFSFNKTFTSPANYSNFVDWWNGVGIGNILNDGDQEVGGTGNCPINNIYAGVNVPTPLLNECDNFFWFGVPSVNPENSTLYISGTNACSGGGEKRSSSISASIEIYRNQNTFVFETQPSDTLPDVFFENDLAFDIDSLGQHQGNILNQVFSTGQPAVVDTHFFNCFTFGNGVESYKILDSITGRPFNFGNRVTTVSAQDYKEADRFADITYSGNYNDESNVNRLNEFNLGLFNYKPLEDSFGPIYILDARQTDVLVLQEDKISFVLAEKNLLSDASGGGALTSVPEVLGTQVARTEKYGISFNPESYIQWGEDRFFTDAKRGAVIQLRTSDIGGDGQLNVISEMGMRTWFRDVFNSSFGTQKLGGYDPYLDEYVLASNDRLLPDSQECLDCSVTQVFTFTEAERQFNYCVNVGSTVGEVTVSYNVINLPFGETFEVESIYNGSTQTTGEVSTSGSFTINKDSNSVDVVDINLYTSGIAVIEVTVSCPHPTTLTIVEVVLTNNSEAGQTTRVEYRYTDGAYVGSLQSNLVTFQYDSSIPVVSRYNMVSGYQGTSGIPTDGSTIRMANNKFFPASFNFDPLTNKFRYLRSDTLYTNTSVDMYALLGASANATPINGGGTYYYADFTVPSSGQYLYLVWDYRTPHPVELCFDTTSVTDVCCNCQPCADDCSYWSVANLGDDTAEVSYLSCLDGTPTFLSVPVGEVANICGKTNESVQVVSGTVRIQTEQQCGCPS